MRLVNVVRPKEAHREAQREAKEQRVTYLWPNGHGVAVVVIIDMQAIVLSQCKHCCSPAQRLQ